MRFNVYTPLMLNEFYYYSFKINRKLIVEEKYFITNIVNVILATKLRKNFLNNIIFKN